MPNELAPIIDRDHTYQLSLLQRFWIAALLLQLAATGLAMAAVPKYDTGSISISPGMALAAAMLITFAFYLVTRWERAKLARIPLTISDAMASVVGPTHLYVFAEPREALSRAIRASGGPTLVRLALVSAMAFGALMTRYRGASLAFVLVLLAVSFFVEWRLFPTMQAVVEKLERVKGVKLAAIPTPVVEPPIHFAAPV